MRVLLLSEREECDEWNRLCREISILKCEVAADVGETLAFVDTFYVSSVLFAADCAETDIRAVIELTGRKWRNVSFFAFTKTWCEKDVARKLNLGLDDVFHVRQGVEEIVCRMRSSIRRRHGLSCDAVDLGSVIVNTWERYFQIRDQKHSITELEAATLDILLLNLGKVLTREQMLDYIYFGQEVPSSRVLDVAICKLRKKIQLDTGVPIIETVRDSGYRIRNIADVTSILAA